MELESNSAPIVDDQPWVNLSQYDQSWYDRGRPGWYVLLWWLIQSVAFPLSLHNANGFRCWLLRRFGATIGKKVIIRPTARFTYPWKVSIGDYSWVGDDVVFYSLEAIKIGSHSVISQKCYLCTGSHDFQDQTFNLMVKPIIIGNGVWVATDCFIAPGVKIGSNAVIGARSSVFKDITVAMVAWGSPCKGHYPRNMNS
ncbi:hormogonium polysaccharide biosynthesis acetyltransferase HpsU [Cyanothece sp. BG0011]|uniref:hormogonium polysaccharide biosynthesis acetyltransferase HpsU n=1 Tax=Cyanothece sp. BG0011 TaxID=2082950 RepID=UPI000D1E02D1|nr:hormogonium polysaccharide biosynthesis acetyltransferase HpsU [Cyanothece sp. BG0011]